MELKKILLLGISILALNLSAQTSSDTLDIAKQYYNKSRYTEAANILSKFLHRNPNNVYAHWLYGEVAHKNGQKKVSASHFEKALDIQPGNDDIRMAYARTLFFSKQLKKSTEEFERIISQSKNEDYISEAHLMLSYIDFWDMELTSSKYHVNQILKINPHDNLALQQKAAIEQVSAPYLKVGLEYLNDDQPLSSFSEKVEVGMARSNLLNFAFYIKNQNFDTHNQVAMANLKNTFTISDIDMLITFSAGFSRHFKDSYDWHGEVEFSKKIVPDLFIKAGLNRQPYLYTEKSTYKSYAEKNFYTIIDYDNLQFFSANFIYQNKFFSGENHVNTVGGWIMSKYFGLGLVEAKAGYAFSYSDAKRSSYVPEAPIESYPLGSQLPGFYDFYFTPDNQIIHSAVAALKFTISPSLALYASGGYGIYARNNSPLLFSTDDPSGNYTLLRTSYREKFHPYNLGAKLNYKISEKFNLQAYYEYQETSFYKLNKAGVQLFYIF